MRIGLAVRSSSSALMLSLSEKPCIILQILPRKIYTHYAAGCVVLQETLLMGFQEKALCFTLWQEELSPLGIVQQPLTGVAFTVQLEGDECKRVQGEVDVGEVLLDTAFEHAEVAQSGEQTLHYSTLDLG